MIKKVYEIVTFEDAGYWMLLEDGIGMAKSKSRNALKRIRDALQTAQETGLIGLTVEIEGVKRGIVQAISDRADLIVRRTGVLQTDNLEVWPVHACRLVEPDKIDTPTPWNDPAIGVIPAIKLLERVLACGIDTMGHELETVADDIKKFLKAREDAQPTP